MGVFICLRLGFLLGLVLGLGLGLSFVLGFGLVLGLVLCVSLCLSLGWRFLRGILEVYKHHVGVMRFCFGSWPRSWGGSLAWSRSWVGGGSLSSSWVVFDFMSEFRARFRSRFRSLSWVWGFKRSWVEGEDFVRRVSGV